MGFHQHGNALPCSEDVNQPPDVVPTPYVVFCPETQSTHLYYRSVLNYCPNAPRFDSTNAERHNG